MPIDQIKEEIISRRDSELEALRSRFSAELLSINTRVEKQKSEIASSYKKKIGEDTAAHVKRTVDGATLEARRIVNARMEELLNSGLAMFLDQMKAIRDSKEYTVILNSMVKTIIRMMGNNCIIYVRHEDAPKINAVETDRVRESNLDGVGGLIARSTDGRVELDLTLTTVFRDIRGSLLQEISSRIR